MSTGAWSFSPFSPEESEERSARGVRFGSWVVATASRTNGCGDSQRGIRENPPFISTKYGKIIGKNMGEIHGNPLWSLIINGV